MKNTFNKICFAFCIVATSTCLAPPSSPAVERLVIRNDSDEITFKVCDTGVAVGNQFSMGTLTPQAPFHINLPSNIDGVPHPVGTELYSVSTGSVMSSQDNSAALDLTVADGYLVQGRRGAIRGVRARGTLENPTAAGPEDQVVSLLAGVYDGSDVLNTADINLTVDGPVSPGVAPVRISFKTKPGGTGEWVEHMTIKNDGKVGIGSTNPTSRLQVTGLPVYADNNEATAAGLTPGAFYRTATGVLMVCY